MLKTTTDYLHPAEKGDTAKYTKKNYKDIMNHFKQVKLQIIK